MIKKIIRKNYHWLISICGTLAMFSTVGFTSSGISIFLPYLIKALGITKAQGSGLLTIRSIVSVVSVIIAEQFYKRNNSKKGIVIAMATVAVGYFLYGFIPNYIGFCIMAVVMGIAYCFGGMIPLTLLMNKWFVKKRGTALGICAAGSGLTMACSSLFLTRIIEEVSLKAAFCITGAILMLITVFFALVVKDYPEEKGLKAFYPENIEEKKRAAAASPENSSDRMSYYLLLAAMVFTGATSNPAYSHISVLYSFENYASTAVALLLSVGGIALSVGKCINGALADRKGLKFSNYMFFIMLIAGDLLCSIANIGNEAVAFISVVLVGMGVSLSSIEPSLYAGYISSESELVHRISRMILFCNIGVLSFSVVPGIVADNTGSYTGAYRLMAVSALMGLICSSIAFGRIDKKK